MATTPPKAGGSPREEAWRRWAEESISTLVNGNVVRDTRVQAVTQVATNVGNTAANAAIDANNAIEASKGIAPTNRVARPVTDAAYWVEVVAGRQVVWQTDGDASNARNAASVASGLVLTPTVDEGAEIDLTPLLPIPATAKLYVRAAYTGTGSMASPMVQVTIRSADGQLHPDVVTQPAPVSGVGSTVELPNVEGGFYTVKAFVAAGEPTAFITYAEVFEVIGAGDGLNIGPGGISVEDENGDKIIEIAPSAPILAAPVMPILTTGVGSVSVRWNGLLMVGVTLPAHFSYVRAEQADAVGGPWVRIGQTLSRAGDIMARPPIGTTKWFRFIAVDTMNRESDPSEASSITVGGVEFDDIPGLQGELDDLHTTADGKNRIWVRETQPTEPAVVGDLWFQLQPGGTSVIAIKVYNGATWVPQVLYANDILAAESITTPLIAAGAVLVDNLEPNIGEKINITANEGLRVVAGNADDALAEAISARAIADGAGAGATNAARQAQAAQEAAAEANNALEQSRSVYDFSPTGLQISTPSSVYSLNLTSDGITIEEGGRAVSLWDAGQMIVDKFVGSEVVLANHKIESRGTRTLFRSM